MWKDTVLQILIALFPVFLFMVWHDRAERTRYAHIFLAVLCAVSMVLSMHYSTVTEQGQHIDFRFVPLLIGALYGGIPSAVALSIVYVIVRTGELITQLNYIIFYIDVAIFLPILLSRISAFQRGSRADRLKVTYMLCVMLLLLAFVSYLYSIADTEFNTFLLYTVLTAAYGLAVLFVSGTAVHFTELAFERVQLQSELRDVSVNYRNEVRRLQQFIDNTPLIVVFLNAKGLVTHVNDLTLKLMQIVNPTDVINQSFGYLVKRMDMQFESCPVSRVMQGEERVTEMVTAHGRSFYTVCCPVKDAAAGGPEGILFIGHDVTELQLLKAEVGRMERLSLVGQMAASITHEIRNPMAVIRGFVQLLNERGGEDQQYYFRIVLEELDRANAIINDFLSLAQNRIIEKEPANLHDLLKDLLPLIWADANMRGQSVDLQLSPSLDWLDINSKEIKQLILNLARNGMEAMDDKGVLRIETRNLAESVELRVIDNGVGMPQETLERLFQPFYTTKASGTGLGLALCLSIVERHNGKIRVESAVGQGTTFIVTFNKSGAIAV